MGWPHLCGRATEMAPAGFRQPFVRRCWTRTGARFHDLRHFYASLLISSGLDVKVVQARLRHAIGQDDARHVRAPVAGLR